MKSLPGIIILTCLTPTAQAAELTCRGSVDVKGSHSSYQSSAYLRFGTSTAEGAKFALGSPITEDIEPVVPYTIVFSAKTSRGTEIIARSDANDPPSEMRFVLQYVSPGKMRLADFKGFEGQVPFGPNELECSY